MFYIDQKFKENNAYKKLFAYKKDIKHKSSFMDIAFNYQF